MASRHAYITAAHRSRHRQLLRCRRRSVVINKLSNMTPYFLKQTVNVAQLLGDCQNLGDLEISSRFTVSLAYFIRRLKIGHTAFDRNMPED